MSVGPFESEALAENKCTLLKAEGTSCLVREEVTEEKQDRKAPVQPRPTYVAVLSDGTSDEEIIVSEGDRLGNGGGIVVSIFENRLIVQEVDLSGFFRSVRRQLLNRFSHHLNPS